MKVELLQLFDRDVDELVDVFLPVLIAWSRGSIIPEVYQVFGAEKTMRFLDIFAGVRFDVPSRDVILRALRDAEVYVGLTTGRQTPASLARQFAIDEWTVEETHRRVAALLEGVSLLGGNGHHRNGRGGGRG